MRKLKELWTFIKGVFKDRAPYVVIWTDKQGKDILATVQSERFGADVHCVFVGNWQGAHDFMRYRVTQVCAPGFWEDRNIRIAIATDVPQLSHAFKNYN